MASRGAVLPPETVVDTARGLYSTRGDAQFVLPPPVLERSIEIPQWKPRSRDTGGVSDAVVLGITGIVVSGVVGPAVAAWLARRAELGRFDRDQVSHRREQVRALLDEAAVLLASGPTNLRVLREAPAGSSEKDHASDWLRQVFPIGQRLQLWLPGDHPAICSYEEVREALVQAVEASTLESEGALSRFEGLREQFLEEARRTPSRRLLGRGLRYEPGLLCGGRGDDPRRSAWQRPR